jgi:D-amino-acid dehydrogenase
VKSHQKHDRALAKKLGRDLMMVPAKGYSITFQMEEAIQPKTSTLFYDIFTAMTPRRDTVRITSKMELNVPDNTPHQKMVNKILKTFTEYVEPFTLHKPKIWAGNRPLTPNDIPLIGRDEKYHNLVHATGLGWLGVTFAPAVGKIIAELIAKEQENRQNKDIMLFSGFYQGC